MTRPGSVLFVFALLGGGSGAGVDDRAEPAAPEIGLRLEVFPGTPYVEVGAAGRELNFDLLVGNDGPRALEITRVELRVLDGAGRLNLRRFVDAGNGSGLEAVPVRKVEPGTTITLFNPFPVFAPDLPLDTLQVVVEAREMETEEVGRAAVAVRPVMYEQRTELVLPTVGTVMVWDGNDFHSHHRRQDVARLRQPFPGLRDNPVRFAYDFSAVDDAGALHGGDPDDVEGWHAYGAPVRAPAAGTVVSSANDVPDNRIEDGRLVYAESMPQALEPRLYGNHLIIDHGEGEYSLLAHLGAGTLTVGPGDRVERGQVLGRVGFSGDTGLHVHVHYQLMSDPSFQDARSLPSRFRDFERRVGGAFEAVGLGTVETGEILRSSGARP